MLDDIKYYIVAVAGLNHVNMRHETPGNDPSAYYAGVCNYGLYL